MKKAKFQELIMPHLDAAYNYALWLARDAHDAEDLTQEAFSRALAAFGNYKDTNPRAWLLTIVRNLFLNEQQQRKQRGEVIYLDTTATHVIDHPLLRTNHTPEQTLIAHAELNVVSAALQQLPTESREILVLRELHGFSYEEIAGIINCAAGTVMSRLSRARSKLRTVLNNQLRKMEGSS